MRRKVVAVWVSLLIMVSSIVILVEIAERVEAPTTLYVGGAGGGNYSKIQWAIDNASSGDTVFVYNGTYYENVAVNESINLIGEDRNTTIINGSYTGDVVRITADWVHITGFFITGSGSSYKDSGIELYYVKDCEIFNNNISFNYGYGLFLFYSNRNNLTYNIISNNGYGLYPFSSYDNNLSNNNIINNFYGIDLRSSFSNSHDADLGRSTYYALIVMNTWSEEDTITLSYNATQLPSNWTVSFEWDTFVVLNYSSKLVICNISTSKETQKGVYNISILATSSGGQRGSVSLNTSVIKEFEDEMVGFGDEIQVNYIGYYISGEIRDTSLEEIAKNDNYSKSKDFWISPSYSPLKMYVGSPDPDTGDEYMEVIEGFWESVIGMKINETTVVRIPPEKAYNDGITWIFEINIVSIDFSNVALTVHNLNTGENFSNIQAAMDDSDTMNGHTITVDAGIYYENVVVNKRINLTGENKETTIINGQGINAPVRLNSDWVNLTGFSIINGVGYPGIIIFASNINISRNIINNNIQGVFFQTGGINTNISNNIISNSVGASGIFCPIPIENSIFSYNKIFSSVSYGINLVNGPDNVKIIGNFIAYNNIGGIKLNTGTNNLITNNDIWNNGDGMVLFDSANNQVYHNNIIGNNNQADDNSNDGNQWDNGYPSGGNYWSDYTGIDFNSTPTQDVPPPDDIGDTPYVIDSNSKDNYPSMVPFGNFTILPKGWNLISLPLIQPKTNLDSVLSFIDGNYDAVQWYDNTNSSDPWKHNHIAKPAQLNDLNDLNHNQGVWVNITKPDGAILYFLGFEPIVNQTITLYPGWNLVGYPSLTSYNRTDGLNNLTFGTVIDAIQWFDASAKTWHFMDQNDFFEPGRGYWVHSKVEVEWEVPR